MAEGLWGGNYKRASGKTRMSLALDLAIALFWLAAISNNFLASANFPC